MANPLLIDGSSGEGGGQILRSSLALSILTGRAFRIYDIRANRPKPGLRRQHLTCVLAAAAISNADVTGGVLDSREVTFAPRQLQAGDYHFDVGSAGSTMLVLQTILPPLMTASGPSTITLEGGTHNFGAPPFPFLSKTFLPLINRMGPRVDLRIERAGFVPRGGGRAVVRITPAPLKPIQLLERGPIRRTLARATIAGLPRSIAERELKLIARVLTLKERDLVIEELPADQGPGNVVTVEVESEHLMVVFTAFGARGIAAEDVARDAARQAKRYIARDVPVDEHLADQLLLPLALAGSGSYLTGPPSLHATTNIQTLRQFIDVAIDVREISRRQYRVSVGRAG
ncbi:MAG: 3-terminal phosphate cyclase [Phycisphaerales bacterium]|nr:3-terminal phosphate cyclase [Phycisphaerales bacterium]